MLNFKRSIKQALPVKLHGKAKVLGRDDLRFFADISNPAFIQKALSIIEKDFSGQTLQRSGAQPDYSALAISGGSGDGAYGAGLLKGWSANGRRPVFKAVTGISTGALIAPLAFLGEEYDDVLEEFYTTTSTKGVLSFKGPVRIILGNSLVSNRPLERIIRKIVTDDFLKRVAAEHARGRGLYIGTTDFDAQRLVLWNMGKIAEIGTPEAADLFCRVVLASTAIPVVFPPVFIDVEAEGKKYREMHVDGGAITQVFFLYGPLRGIEKKASENHIDRSALKVKLHVILNGYLKPISQPVGDNLAAIYERYMETMSLAQSWADMARLYHFAEEFGHDFYAAYIPDSFVPQAREEFDVNNMKKLFELGYNQAKNGYPWMRKMADIMARESYLRQFQTCP